MTVEEAAIRLGKSKWCIYKMIHQGRGIGRKFKKNKFGAWVIDGRMVKANG